MPAKKTNTVSPKSKEPSTNGRKKTTPTPEAPKPEKILGEELPRPRKVQIDQPKEEAPSRLSMAEVMEAASFDRQQALSLVDFYYSLQELRKATANQDLAHSQNRNAISQPHLITLLAANLSKLERQSARGLAKFAEASPLGQWCLSIAGVGHIITAGLLAHIDLKRCSCIPYRHLRGKDRDNIPPHDCPGLATAGAIHRFAGMIDPDEIHWEKGQIRPYNARLKVICFNLGECFKKIPKEQDCSGEEYLYVRLYRERKIREVERNEAGLNADRALGRLQDAIRGNWRTSSEQREIWASGKLQPVGLDLRAKRYAVCMFLSHFHTVGREILGLPVVKPWVLEHGGHSHYTPPPLLSVVRAKLKEMKK